MKTNLNLALILVVTLVLAAYGVWDVMRIKASETVRQEHDVASVLNRLALGLPKPLWDFSMTTVDDILHGEMSHPAILGIAVLDEQGALVVGLAQGEKEIEKVDALPDLPRTTKAERKLSYSDGTEDHPIGSVVLFVSKDPLRQAVRDAIVRNLIIMLVLNAVLVLSLGFALTRLVLKPLDQILLRVRDIAEGEGDLTKRVESPRRDELGHLAQALNQFIASIRDIVTQVNGVIEGLNDSAHQAKEITQDLNLQLNQQQEDLYMLTTSLTEFSATTDEVARNAALVAESGEQAGKRAEAGLQLVREANASNSELAATVDEASGVISELRQSTEAITGILDVIRGIADQTNLLALNAAIEAARAGEQGRGFAVVADEVRTLSQRTQDSTRQIQETIEGLRERTQQAVETMAQSKLKSTRSVELASDAGEAFAEIDEAIKQIIQMMTSVATAAEQQSSTVAEIDRNVSSIQQVHQKTVVLSDSTNVSGESLASSVTRLRSLFAKFRF
ncbi:methyl-accepting chemotaxis protein [Thiorhodococcus fuscus]|uniref:Methyl-accepting chemotaxis protein n=1 Tax=Thiorhodococcus fuscus TaxID=527200 RepID=A0ABW4Y7T8_9GAMM